MTTYQKTILIFDDAESMTCTSQLGQSMAEAFCDDHVAIVKADRHNFAKAIEELKPNVIILPEIRGERSYYNDHLGDAGKQAIRNAIGHGALFIGFCAGAYFACDNIVYAPQWGAKKKRNGKSTLSLFNATGFGPLPSHGRPSNGKENLGGCVPVDVYVYDRNKYVQEKIWYGNGPTFIPHNKMLPQGSQVIAAYANTGLQGKTGLAVCKIPYGKGSVIPCGVLPHYHTPPVGGKTKLWGIITNEVRQHLFAFKPLDMVPQPA